MAEEGAVVVVGGTGALGGAIGRHFAVKGREVVVCGRRADHAAAVAEEIGGRTRGVAFDLAKPAEIAPALKDVGPVQYLVLAAIERFESKVRDYDPDHALRLVTLKLVGNTEVVHALANRFKDDSSIVIFGGEAKDKPYPGSSMVTTVNAAMTGLVRTLMTELAPIRVNAIHPGYVGDSPYWLARTAAAEAARAKTPTGKLPTTQDVVDAVAFLLTNPAANGIDLQLDGGWHL
jgi:NAD(P)-dependent dehydrogenase (short-subunit alcohol dehydrogenase family)